MCDVGVKIFTIFFKTTKKNKKTCKKFCRLQKDLYLCSVNKKTTKHMKRKYHVIIKGESRELDEKAYNQFIYCLLLAKFDFCETIERRFSKDDEIVINTITI